MTYKTLLGKKYTIKDENKIGIQANIIALIWKFVLEMISLDVPLIGMISLDVSFKQDNLIGCQFEQDDLIGGYSKQDDLITRPFK